MFRIDKKKSLVISPERLEVLSLENLGGVIFVVFLSKPPINLALKILPFRRMYRKPFTKMTISQNLIIFPNAVESKL